MITEQSSFPSRASECITGALSCVTLDTTHSDGLLLRNPGPGLRQNARKSCLFKSMVRDDVANPCSAANSGRDAANSGRDVIVKNANDVLCGERFRFSFNFTRIGSFSQFFLHVCLMIKENIRSTNPTAVGSLIGPCDIS